MSRVPPDLVRMVKVSKPGQRLTNFHQYVGTDSSQKVVVVFSLDHPTGEATNRLIEENGEMLVVVRPHQIIGVEALTP